jgi:two-component system OmpR family sensor kinase
MLSETHRLDALIADLLDLARLGAVEFPVDIVEVDLRDVALSADEVWSDRCAAEGVEWYCHVPERPVLVRCDPQPGTADHRQPRGQRSACDSGRAPDHPAGRDAIRPPGTWRCAMGGRVCRTVTSRWRSSRPSCTAGTVDCARSVRASGWRWSGRLADRIGGRASAGHAPEGGACFRVSFPPVAQ